MEDNPGIFAKVKVNAYLDCLRASGVPDSKGVLLFLSPRDSLMRSLSSQVIPRPN